MQRDNIKSQGRNSREKAMNESMMRVKKRTENKKIKKQPRSSFLEFCSRTLFTQNNVC